jgi:hypothetical protein
MCDSNCCNWWRYSESAAHAATHVVRDVVQRQERCVALNAVTGGVVKKGFPMQLRTCWVYGQSRRQTQAG